MSPPHVFPSPRLLEGLLHLDYRLLIFLSIDFQLLSESPTPVLMVDPSNSWAELDCLVGKTLSLPLCPPTTLLYSSQTHRLSARSR